MEDKITSKSINDIKDFIISHSICNFNNEICGFIGFDEIEKCFVATLEKNESSDPRSFFSINPASYLKFKNQYSMLSIFHSHVIGDENPSDFDIRMSEASCLTFTIFSINSHKFYIYEPQNKDYNVNILTRLKEKIL